MLTIASRGKAGVVDAAGNSALDYYKEKELSNTARVLDYYGAQIGAGMLKLEVANPTVAFNGRPVGINFMRVRGAPFDVELLPQWHGKLAKKWGLTDPTDAASLHHMLEHTMEKLAQGYSPDASQSVKGAGNGHMIGYDLTFSIAKELSMFMAFGDDELKKLVYQMHNEAVRRVLDELEHGTLMTRFGAQGATKSEIEGAVFSLHHHRSSRDGDPQLHTHCLLYNIVEAADPQTGERVFRTIDSKTMFGMKMAAGALYRSHVAKACADLGLIIDRTGKKLDMFAVRGFPEQVLDRASKRANAIEQHLKDKGLLDAHAAVTAVAKLATRKAKDEPPYPELRKIWRDEEGNYGWSAEQSDELIAESRKLRAEGAVKPYMLRRSDLLARVTQMEATFHESDLIHAIATESVGHWDVDQVLEVSRDITSSLIVDRREMDAYHRVRYTTPEMLAMERFIQDEVGRGLTDRRHEVPASVALKLLKQYEIEERDALRTATSNPKAQFELKDEQIEAAMKALSGTGTVAIIKGAAGTGKTTVAKGIARVFEIAGFNVIGTAISSGATTNLGKEADVVAFNITHLLTLLRNNHHKAQGANPPRLPLNEKTVVFVDESGMVDTRSMYALMKYQKELGFKLALFGDTRQLAPVEAGAVQRTTENNYGKFIAAAMTEITRQREAPMRQAVLRSMNAHHLAHRINIRGEAINSRGQLARTAAERIPLYRALIATPEQHEQITKLEDKAVALYFDRLATAAKIDAERAARAAGTPVAASQAAQATRIRAVSPVDAPAGAPKRNIPADPLSARRINDAIRAKLRAQNQLGVADHALRVERNPPGVAIDTPFDGERIRFTQGVRFTHPIAALGIAQNAAGTIQSLRQTKGPDGERTALFATIALAAAGGAPARTVEVDLRQFPSIECEGERVVQITEGERIRFTQAISDMDVAQNALGTIESLRAKIGPDGERTALIATIALDKAGDAESRTIEIDLQQHHDIEHGYCVRENAEEQLKDLRARNADSILDTLDKMGRLHLIDQRREDEIYRRLVADWIDAEMVWPGCSRDANGRFAKVPAHAKLMLAGENRSVKRLNEIARETFRQRGVLKGDDYSFLRPAEKSDGEHDARRQLAVGERVILTAPYRDGKIRLDNGTRATVVKLERNTRKQLIMTIAVDSTDVKNHNLEVKLNLSKFNEVDLGYATTIHKAQGQTVDKAFVLHSSAMGNSQWFYVAISRARWATQVYAAAQDIGEMRDDMGVREDQYKQLSRPEKEAIDHEVQKIAMANRIAQDGAKHSAIDHPSRDPQEGITPLASPYEPILPKGGESLNEQQRARQLDEAGAAVCAGELVAPAPNGEDGPFVLLAHGKARYQNKKDGAPSYFWTLRDAQGKERTVWGAHIERVVKECGVKVGDSLGGMAFGKEPVPVKVRVIGEDGKIRENVVDIEPQELLRVAREILRAEGRTSLSQPARAQMSHIDPTAMRVDVIGKVRMLAGEPVGDQPYTEEPVTVWVRGLAAQYGSTRVIGVDPQEIVRAARETMKLSPVALALAETSVDAVRQAQANRKAAQEAQILEAAAAAIAADASRADAAKAAESTAETDTPATEPAGERVGQTAEPSKEAQAKVEAETAAAARLALEDQQTIGVRAKVRDLEGFVVDRMVDIERKELRRGGWAVLSAMGYIDRSMRSATFERGDDEAMLTPILGIDAKGEPLMSTSSDVANTLAVWLKPRTAGETILSVDAHELLRVTREADRTARNAEAPFAAPSTPANTSADLSPTTAVETSAAIAAATVGAIEPRVDQTESAPDAVAAGPTALDVATTVTPAPVANPNPHAGWGTPKTPGRDWIDEAIAMIDWGPAKHSASAPGVQLVGAEAAKPLPLNEVAIEEADALAAPMDLPPLPALPTLLTPAQAQTRAQQQRRRDAQPLDAQTDQAGATPPALSANADEPVVTALPPLPPMPTLLTPQLAGERARAHADERARHRAEQERVRALEAVARRDAEVAEQARRDAEEAERKAAEKAARDEAARAQDAEKTAEAERKTKDQAVKRETQRSRGIRR